MGKHFPLPRRFRESLTSSTHVTNSSAIQVLICSQAWRFVARLSLLLKVIIPLGTPPVIGSETVSNAERSTGSSCIVERRMIEIIETGAAKTPFMSTGETVEIEMFDKSGIKSLFGKIKQKISDKNFY